MGCGSNRVNRTLVRIYNDRKAKLSKNCQKNVNGLWKANRGRQLVRASFGQRDTMLLLQPYDIPLTRTVLGTAILLMEFSIDKAKR